MGTLLISAKVQNRSAIDQQLEYWSKSSASLRQQMHLDTSKKDLYQIEWV